VRLPDADLRPYGPHPFLVTFTVLPADRNQFLIDAGVVPRDDTSNGI
jgi:hypothetical protein